MAWVQYFWEWLSTAIQAPIRIIEVIFLFLTIAGFVVVQRFPQWEAAMKNLLWGIPLVALAIVLIVSLAVSSYHLYEQQELKVTDLNNENKELTYQLDVARKQAYPPITTLMMSNYFKDLDIPLGDFGLVNSRLEGKTFENCRIHGIVVIYVGDDTTITLSNFFGNPDGSFIVTPNKVVSGVLGITRCTFIHCRFENVSFIGNQEAIDKIKKGFNFN